MMKAKSTKRSPLKIVVIILAVIVVLLYVATGFTILKHAESNGIEYDSRDYIFSAERGRYGDLYDTTIRDMNKQTKYSTEVAECRALAFYYEQAVLEHAYRRAGDTAKADEFVERMDEYAQQLGSLSSKAESVRKAVTANR